MEETMDVDLLSRILALSTAKKSTLSEVIKEFHLFLRDREQEVAKDVNAILANFHPKANVDKIFRAHLIDKYKVSAEVINLLVSDDTFYITQALKCKWFFTNVEDPKDFVDNVIPALSLSTRMKVVNKFSSSLTNTKAGEILYQSMKSRYGTKSAIPLLATCGENFVRNELPNIKMTIPPRVTLSLYKKHPSLTIEYLKYLAEKSKSSRSCLEDYEDVLLKLSSQDLKSFLDLYDEHASKVPYMKLGRRATKKMMKNETNKVLDNFQKYSPLLVEKTFFHRLSYDQFKRVYVSSILPDKVSAFVEGDLKVRLTLQYVKPALRSDLILSTFKAKYLRDITSDDILFDVDSRLVAYLPEEARIKWLEKKIFDTTDVGQQAFYLSKLPVNMSMPRLTKLIESQSDASLRQTISKHMVSSLRQNNYSGGIKDLVAYFVKRFRNEVARFRGQVANELVALEELFLDLSLEDWAPINDFINIMKLNNEIDYTYKYKLRKIYSYQIQTSFAQQKNVTAVLANYLELELADGEDLECDIVDLLEKTTFNRNFLLWLMEEAPKLKWKNPISQAHFTLRLFENICQYNLKNEDKIEFSKWIIESLDWALGSDEKNKTLRRAGRIIEYLRITPIPLLEKYTREKTFPEIVNCDLVCRKLRNEPNLVLQNVRILMEKVLDGRFDDYRMFYMKCRMYDSYGLPSEIIKLCRVNLKLDEPEYDLEPENPLASAKSQPHAVRVAALLLPPNEYLKIIEQFTPTDKKIEEYTPEIRALYELQQAICKSFIDVSSPTTVLPALRKYAVGDYLKLIVGSLLSTCLKVPEKRILPVFEEWINCPVSLRKHLLKLMYRIAPSEYSVQSFVNIFKTEKNTSLRLVLFELLHKTFIDEPGDDTYNTFKSIISQLKKDDEEALKKLFDISGIDPAYVSRYLELLWGLVESDWGSVLLKGKDEILNLITREVLILLSDEFSDVVMSYDLANKLPHSSPSKFLRLYLLFAPSYDTQTSRLNKVMSLLKPLIENHWNDHSFAKGQVFRTRQIISNIVDTLCTESYSSPMYFPHNPIQLLTDLKKAFSLLIKPEHFLHESFQLDLAISYHQHSRSALETDSYVTVVAELYNTYIQKYGNLYGYPLVQCLTQSAQPFAWKEKLAVELITQNNADPICHIVAIELLKSQIEDDQDVPFYKTAINRLSSSEHPSVQVAAHEFFKSLSSTII